MSVVARAYASGALPENQMEFAKQAVKSRFMTANTYYVEDKNMKNQMIRVFVLLLAAAMLLILFSGCGSEQKPDPSGSIGHAAAEETAGSMTPTADNKRSGSVKLSIPRYWYYFVDEQWRVRDRYLTSKQPCKLYCEAYGGEGEIAVQWYLDGNPIEGANAFTYYATVPGVYRMTATDSKGSVSDSDSICVRNAGQNGTNIVGPDDFYMYVDDVFHTTDKGTTVTGTVNHGTVHAGEQLSFYTWDEDTCTEKEITLTLQGIECNHVLLDSASEGEMVGLILGKDADRSLFHTGCVAVAADSSLKATVGAVKGTLYLLREEDSGVEGPFPENEGFYLRPIVDKPVLNLADYATTSFSVKGIIHKQDDTQPFIAGKSYENVSIVELEHPMFLYPGQELSVYSDVGRTLGIFVVTEIGEP